MTIDFLDPLDDFYNEIALDASWRMKKLNFVYFVRDFKKIIAEVFAEQSLNPRSIESLAGIDYMEIAVKSIKKLIPENLYNDPENREIIHQNETELFNSIKRAIAKWEKNK